MDPVVLLEAVPLLDVIETGFVSTALGVEGAPQAAIPDRFKPVLQDHVSYIICNF